MSLRPNRASALLPVEKIHVTDEGQEFQADFSRLLFSRLEKYVGGFYHVSNVYKCIGI